jgi:hypothetical protein
MATMRCGANRWRWRVRRERSNAQMAAMGMRMDPQSGALQWPSGETVRFDQFWERDDPNDPALYNVTGHEATFRKWWRASPPVAPASAAAPPS